MKMMRFASVVRLAITIVSVVALILGTDCFAVVSASTATKSSKDAKFRMNGFVTRSGSKLWLNGRIFRFSGANIYWLGLDENVDGVGYPTHFRIDDALDTAVEMGANVVRSQTLGVSTGNPLSIEPSLGHFNDKAFEPIDYAISEARKRNLRLIIPLTDNWHYYHGGKHDFTDWRGLSENEFYDSPAVIHDFEQYISHVLNHVNRFTGIAYKNDPTIMAWELGNELNGMPTSWVSTISRFIKTIDKHHLVAEGQQVGVDVENLSVPTVDIYDVHYYPITASAVRSDSRLVAAAGKVFIIGEFGSPQANPELFMAIEKDKDISGDLFWSLFAHNDTYGYVQHNDGFTLHYPGDDQKQRQICQWIRNHAFAMRGIKPLPHLRPGRPLITTADRTGTHSVAIAWRGTAVAKCYSVQRSTVGPQGPWVTVCDKGVTDNSLPWDDASAPAHAVWYRVIAYNEVGQAGPPSSAVKVTS